ncbi:DUF1365 domain-containing protein [Aliarcobacter cryaerophilus ATCC 43158]|uniref:DUF1365 domain-containing protein n=1 Tax=Aliarcobacter cryaerophilus ATCC 43158 TaxID=1032070 RepID=A0AAD0X8F1_9BACT|nr:DUF1365 domain-containing protein [Aliarcobacter cryaerophilus]AYJ79629.1 DUF1365 domain-containing protein [Aliarcobacter cryaerophilus ATCC 43158]QCZ23870.1 DUF1365 domain-containing protein [Aliarcobacter cryaerophilus ATCC 43158]
MINKKSNHNIFEGTIYHKRYLPKKYDFKYNFYLLDIDVFDLKSLKNKIFSINRFNLMSLKSVDHFGSSSDFLTNIEELLKKFDLKATSKMRFLTLPRVLNFVFNPISVLVLFDEQNLPTHILAEVHNYNSGRIVYCVKLEKRNNSYFGVVKKDMYVSPFFECEGVYEFELKYDENKLFIKIDLYEDKEHKLTAIFNSKSKPYSFKNILKIFVRYIFSTFLVVSRTFYHAFRLYLKGLKIYTPRDNDKIKRY